jgi:PST family polysaccharide transporter/teichuronic acid exporter
MGLSLVFSALGRQFKTIEQKNFNFKLISIIDIVTHVLSLILAIYLVLNKFGVYSLVYSALFQFFVSNLVFLILGVHKNGLKLYFRFEETKPFLKIGIYQVGGQSISYFSKNFDILIIGKLLGSEVLGAYNLAKQLVGKPFGLLNPILTKVATPSFSIIQNNKLLLKEKYLDFINLGSSLSFFFYGFIILFASIIVDVLYGEEFNNIVNLVRILAVYYYLRSVFNYSGSLLTALGRTDLDFYWNCLSLFVFPTFIYLGAFNGVYGVGWSLVLAMLLSIYPYWKFLIHKMVDCSFGEYIQQTIPNLKIAKVLYKKK